MVVSLLSGHHSHVPVLLFFPLESRWCWSVHRGSIYPVCHSTHVQCGTVLVQQGNTTIVQIPFREHQNLFFLRLKWTLCVWRFRVVWHPWSTLSAASIMKLAHNASLAEICRFCPLWTNILCFNLFLDLIWFDDLGEMNHLLDWCHFDSLHLMSAYELVVRR